MSTFDVQLFRRQFPLLSSQVNNKPLVYFDNGATTQKPKSVIAATSEYYQRKNANVHRASHALSKVTTTEFEQCRERVKQLINADNTAEIIWTKGSTEAINLVAQSWGQHNLSAGDDIVLSHAEHHANIVPWQLLAEQVGASIKVIALDATGVLDEMSIESTITATTKLVCISHASNVIGKINPIEKVIAKARSVGALTLIDGAQVIANKKVDVQALDCDFYVFSAHKMYGPTGLGVLYGKKSILQDMKPYQAGGEMINKVSFAGTTFGELPFKFEAGTPNIAGVVAFARALELIENFQLTDQNSYKQQLIDYGYQQLSTIAGIKFLVDGKPDLAIFSFNLSEHHHSDIASDLDNNGIAVRSGHHCAMPLFDYLGIDGCVRLSLALYNTRQEIDTVITCLKKLLNDQDHKTAPAASNHQQAINCDNILHRFSRMRSWQDKHRELMLLGKHLPKMAKAKRNSQTLVQGCESDAWLEVTLTENSKVSITADSDAKIIRGLLVIVVAAFDDKTIAEIFTVDIQHYFSQLGLEQHLSPSRNNGLLAIVSKIINAAKDINCTASR